MTTPGGGYDSPDVAGAGDDKVRASKAVICLGPVIIIASHDDGTRPLVFGGSETTDRVRRADHRRSRQGQAQRHIFGEGYSPDRAMMTSGWRFWRSTAGDDGPESPFWDGQWRPGKRPP